jgi:hypothetical protein
LNGLFQIIKFSTTKIFKKNYRIEQIKVMVFGEFGAIKKANFLIIIGNNQYILVCNILNINRWPQYISLVTI